MKKIPIKIVFKDNSEEKKPKQIIEDLIDMAVKKVLMNHKSTINHID